LISSDPSPPLVLTRAQVRDVDRRASDDYGLSGLVLMENAGRNAANLLRELGIRGPVVVCCGKGNNAGDGFVIARHLESSGFDVRVLLATPASSFAGDAATNFAVLRRAGIAIVGASADIATAWRGELSQADWIVDALLGTGTQGNVRDPFAAAIAAINAANRKVLAVDLPSGLDCDTGAGLGSCVRADHTATFVARKPAFSLAGVKEFTGEVHVLDIGVPRSLLRELSESSVASSGPSG
jgi:NAD(P)H-hydrate epimerase